MRLTPLFTRAMDLNKSLQACRNMWMEKICYMPFLYYLFSFSLSLSSFFDKSYSFHVYRLYTAIKFSISFALYLKNLFFAIYTYCVYIASSGGKVCIFVCIHNERSFWLLVNKEREREEKICRKTFIFVFTMEKIFMTFTTEKKVPWMSVCVNHLNFCDTFCI